MLTRKTYITTINIPEIFKLEPNNAVCVDKSERDELSKLQRYLSKVSNLRCKMEIDNTQNFININLKSPIITKITIVDHKVNNKRQNEVGFYCEKNSNDRKQYRLFIYCSNLYWFVKDYIFSDTVLLPF